MQTLTAPVIGLNSQKQQRGQWKKHRTLRTHDDNGKVTAYGFSCGYTERESNTENNNTKTLYREHKTYHVQAVINDHKIWETWEATGTGLTEARKFYKDLSIL